MAKISANGAHALITVTATKLDDSGMTTDNLVHLTLVLTSDGRVLRKVTLKYGPGHYGGGNYSVLTRIPRANLANVTAERLGKLAAKWGYEVTS